MDYYKLLLSRVSALPAGTTFTVGQAYKEGWATIPAKDKIAIFKNFKTEVDGGLIPRVIFNGYLSGSTHRHKQYIKLYHDRKVVTECVKSVLSAEPVSKTRIP